MFDKGDLFGAGPAFELFFAGNGGVWLAVGLVKDEMGAAVFRCEAFGFVFLVLGGAGGDAVCDADVEDARTAGHDVDEVLAGHLVFTIVGRGARLESRWSCEAVLW